MADDKPNPLVNLLLSARNAIPENKEHDISLANMLRGGLGSAAGWMDWKNRLSPDDYSPQEILAPIGSMAFGSAPVGSLAAGAIKRGGASVPEDVLRFYRGESIHNKGGPYWTPDMEWARQFTQSGRDHEIRQTQIRKADIYDPHSPVYAGDPDAVDKIVAEARGAGFKAVRLDEGSGQPPSVYVFDRKAHAR